MSVPSNEPNVGPADPTTAEKTILELQHLRNETEKLALEVETLRSSRWWDKVIGHYLPIVTAFLAVAGFWWSVAQYHWQRLDDQKRQAKDESDAREKQAAADRDRAMQLKRDAARTFWDQQLKFYSRAVEDAAVIATTDNEELRKAKEDDFWVMYWGPLSSVEDVGMNQQSTPAVEEAMVKFGKYLSEHPDASKRNKREMQLLALKLAHAMRNEAQPKFDLFATPISRNP
jgi:hypothetical protein